MRSKIIRLTTVLAILLFAAPLADGSQPTGRVDRVAILAFPTGSTPGRVANIEALRQRLRELGWIEGRNVTVELRFVERDRLDEAAAEIVRDRFDLVVTVGLLPTLAAKKATAAIPIVMATNADPVGSGAVASLARPGGNVTGISNVGGELTAKRLELLKVMVPRLRRVAALYPEAVASVPFVVEWMGENTRAAKVLGLALRPIPLKEPFDWESTFAAVKADGAGALTVIPSPDLLAQAPAIAAAALKHRLPAVFAFREHAEAGGLFAYASDFTDQHRRAAAYVDKILKGAKPGDLPVEQPTKFELVINLKTAKTLGLTIPQSVLLQADQVIE